MFYCGAARLATAAATCVLPVILRCGAARLAAAACALPAISPSGGCVSCRTVVLPVSPPPPLPVRRLSCCRWVVACRAALWCCPPCRCRRCLCCLRCLRATCRAARLAAAAAVCAACAPPVMLPASPLPPLPACHLSCCPPHCCRRCLRATCRAALWCCLPRRCCLHAACCVAIGRLCVVLRCGAAHLAAAACALPAVSPSGGCVSCRAVVLPTLPPLPARCLPCRRRAVACRAALWCCPRRRCHRRLCAACRVAVGRLCVVPRCGAARIAAACTLHRRHHCCRAAHCVAVRQLRVVQRCAAAHAAAAVLVMSPSCGCHRRGGCHWVVPAHTI